MRELRITPVYNLPYRPDRNAVELTFNHLKTNFRKLRMRKLVDGKNYNAQSLVRKSLELISKEAIRLMMQTNLIKQTAETPV